MTGRRGDTQSRRAVAHLPCCCWCRCSSRLHASQSHVACLFDCPCVLARRRLSGRMFARSFLMRMLGHMIICAWVAFPVIWVAAASGLLTPDQEAAIFTLTDLIAKAGCT